MHRLLILFAGLLVMAGCQSSHHARGASAPPPHLYYVPSAALVQKAESEVPPQPSQVLPGSDGDIFIARGERMAIGTTPLATYSTHSIYIYDAQPIGVRGSGWGHRYRWVLEQGLSQP